MRQDREGEIVSDTLDRLLTAAEAATLLGLKEATIRRLTYTKAIPCVHPTGKRCVRYKRKDLEGLIRMRSQPMHDERQHRSGQCKGQPEAAYEEHLTAKV